MSSLVPSESRSAFLFLWGVALAGVLLPARAVASEAPAGVAPGGSSDFFEVGDSCPTFSWTAVAGARGYELRAYAVAEIQASDAEPVLAVRLPAGASSWTPSTAHCLARGERYAWSLRALGAERPTEWSEALLFEVAMEPAEGSGSSEAARRLLGGGNADAESGAEGERADRRRAARSGARDADERSPRRAVSPGVVGAITGLRARLSQPTGLTYGVLGIVDSPEGAGVRADNDGGGPDLVLGGTTVAEVSETGLSRESASDVTFNFANPGAGSMTLLVDGSPVLTTVGDPWVDETGDTMTGTLTLSPPGAGNALVTTAGRVGILTPTPQQELDVAGDIAQSGALYQGGQRMLHSPGGGGSNVGVGPDALNPATAGTENTAAGLVAMQSNTTGSINTAVGYGALRANTTGSGNAALGGYALDANQVGVYNTALGARSLGTATTGSNNIGIGAYAGHDLVGSNNIAIGHLGLAADSGVIRIGTAPTHSKAFVAGIHGTTLAGPFSPVVVDAAGQLGVATGGGVGNADTLDSLDSSQFLRSDVDDTMTAMLSLTGTSDWTLNIGSSSHVNLGLNTRVYKDEALFLHDVGVRNVGLGRAALINLTTGAANTGVGYHAAYFNSSGAHNTGVGSRALYANTLGAYNTAVGSDALRQNVDGIRNTATGFQALQLNTTGDNNTATGYGALALNTAGNFNIAVGVQALQLNTTGSSNSAVGQSALRFNTTGQGNTAVGFVTLGANTTGVSNTGVGRNALAANTTASSNTALGAYALDANTTGAGNTALGANALGSVTTVGSLTAVGSLALEDNTTGVSNTAVGAVSLANNTTGSYNTAVGNSTLLLNTGGSSNTAVGASALSVNSSGYSNTAVGRRALLANTTGGQNTAVGHGALDSNTTASANTAVGTAALSTNTSGGDNTAAGWASLAANTTGNSNTAFGSRALDSNTTGNYNTAVGASALAGVTTSRYNTAIGLLAAAATTTGEKNTALGSVALTLNTTGFENTAVGFRALSGNTTGDSNTAVGYNSLETVTDAIGNVAVGNGAMRFSSGTHNVAVGNYSLDSTTGGDRNVAVGDSALRGNGGDRNVAIGSKAMWQSGAGNGNIAIGYEAGFYVSGSNNIDIGHKGPFGSGSAHNGRITLGEDGTHDEVYIHGIWEAEIPYDTANVMINELGQLGTTTSSRRFKEHIEDLGAWSERVLDLRPVSFRYKPKPTDGGRERPLEFGLIAEEVAEVFPELVIWGDDGRPRTVKYHLLVPLLLGEVQRQRQGLESQELALRQQAERTADLEAELSELRAMVARLVDPGVRETTITEQSSGPSGSTGEVLAPER